MDARDLPYAEAALLCIFNETRIPDEPALVVHVAEVVAREKGVSVAEIDRVTTENAGRFFGWK